MRLFALAVAVVLAAACGGPAEHPHPELANDWRLAMNGSGGLMHLHADMTGTFELANGEHGAVTADPATCAIVLSEDGFSARFEGGPCNTTEWHGSQVFPPSRSGEPFSAFHLASPRR